METVKNNRQTIILNLLKIGSAKLNKETKMPNKAIVVNWGLTIAAAKNPENNMSTHKTLCANFIFAGLINRNTK